MSESAHPHLVDALNQFAQKFDLQVGAGGADPGAAKEFGDEGDVDFLTAFDPLGGDAAYLDEKTGQLYMNHPVEGFLPVTPEQLLSTEINPLDL